MAEKETHYFISLQGLESQYSKTQFDMSMKEDFTRDLADLIEHCILGGLARQTIVEALCKELNFKYPNAKILYQKVESKIYKKGTEKKNTMLSKNILRLEFIYNESMKNGNIQNALKAIDLLNKVCNLYSNNIEVTQTAFTFQLGNNEPTQLPESIEITPIEVVNENNEENELINE